MTPGQGPAHSSTLWLTNSFRSWATAVFVGFFTLVTCQAFPFHSMSVSVLLPEHPPYPPAWLPCLAHAPNLSPGSLCFPPDSWWESSGLGTRQASSLQCVPWVSSTSIPLLIKQSTSRVAGMVLDQIFASRELMAHFLPLWTGGLVESRNLVSSNTFSASVMLNTGPAHSKYPGKLFFVFCF